MVTLSHADRFNYDLLPILESLQAYVSERRPVGDFLTAILTNDLARAVAHADDTNVWLIPIYYGWVYNEAPQGCHGSKEKVKAWLAGSNA